MHDLNTEFNILKTLFHNVKFTISISLGSLSHIVSNKQSIALVITHHYYCYTQSPRRDDHYIVRKKCTWLHNHVRYYTTTD